MVAKYAIHRLENFRDRYKEAKSEWQRERLTDVFVNAELDLIISKLWELEASTNENQ